MYNDYQERDILHQRTTNINVRISPMMKMNITEAGARMGLNLSDYINYVLTKAMSGAFESDNDAADTPQYEALQEAYDDLSSDKKALETQYNKLVEANRTLQKELNLYNAVVAPLKSAVGQRFSVNGKPFVPQHPSEIVQHILNHFKFKS